MFQITTEEISKEIINEYIPNNIISREKLINKINEAYQYNPKAYNKASKGDYSFINSILETHIFNFC